MKTKKKNKVARPRARAQAASPQWQVLLRAAHDAAAQAYAPYSRFQVGAAVQDDRGRVFTGCNVENASYGLTSCAERNAIFAAVAQGARKITCVVVFTPTQTPTPPCGACRQVIREFGPKAQIISVCEGDELRTTTLDALLPDSFGPESLV